MSLLGCEPYPVSQPMPILVELVSIRGVPGYRHGAPNGATPKRHPIPLETARNPKWRSVAAAGAGGAAQRRPENLAQARCKPGGSQEVAIT
jgi:hypothetical protein